MSPDEMFKPATYQRVRRPIAEAWTLPPELYVSSEWYRRECERVFMRQWLLLAREEEVPRPGDFMRIDLVGQALVLVRDKDGQLHVLSASCRHRGTLLVEGTGNCAMFSCPYHGWSYALNGDLVGVPGMQNVQDFKRKDWGLRRVRAETWGGFVFVNFDDDAKPLMDSFGGYAARFHNYRPSDMRIARRWTKRIAANWKTWVENSREAYHTDFAHQKSYQRLGRKPDGARFHSSGVPGVYEVNTGSLYTGIQVPPDSKIPMLDSLSAEDRNNSHLTVFFPHLILNFLPNHIMYHHLFPDGPEAVVVTSVMCFTGDAMERPDFEREAIPFYEMADIFLPEDWQLCERIQSGMRSGLATPGRYSLMEKPCYEFANYLLDQVIGR